MAPGWVDGLTWWHVYPLGFSGAETHADHAHGVVHRLRHLATWLDYARDLGCSGLHLGPILASHSHGYDTTDHLHIDRRLGDEHDFEALVAGCRERGMRVLMEGVFHHVGDRHPLLQVALESGPHPTGASEQAARWFQIDWSEGAGMPRYETLAGHDDLVTLNHAEPAVVDYVVHVMDLWLSRGADGWWLDTSYAVPPAFWQQVIPRVRERHPDSWLVGEADGADPISLLASTGLDSVTADLLREPLIRSLNDADLRVLAAEVDALARYGPEHPPLTFAGTHHVTRLASALADPGLFGHAVAALFALPGTPSIYYGDEQAFRGVAEPGPDGLEAVRPMFPENSGFLAPWGWPVYDMHRDLIAMRARNPWLTRARPSAVHVSPTTLALRAEATDGGGRRLTALLNIGHEPALLDVGWRHPELEVQSAGVAEADLDLIPGRAWRIVTHD